MKLYNESGLEIEDPKSFTEKCTIQLFLDADTEEFLAEVFISSEDIIFLSDDCQTTEETKAVIAYAENVKQALIDFKEFSQDLVNTENTL